MLGVFFRLRYPPTLARSGRDQAFAWFHRQPRMHRTVQGEAVARDRQRVCKQRHRRGRSSSQIVGGLRTPVTGKAVLVVSILRQDSSGSHDASLQQSLNNQLARLRANHLTWPRSGLGASSIMINQFAETISGPDRGATRGVLATLVRRKLALFGIAVIALTILLAVAAPLIAPYPYRGTARRWHR